MYRAEGSSKSSHKYCQRLKRALNARSLILESFPQRKIYKAWIFRTVHGIPKLPQIMLVVLVMANATVSSAQSSVSAARLSQRYRIISLLNERSRQVKEALILFKKLPKRLLSQKKD